MLVQQAANSTKRQFAHSPDLKHEWQDASIAPYDAHTAPSTQALNSPAVVHGLLDILLNQSPV
ncbi:hypothetical protein B2J86_15980 [Acidovorax sp. SRB_14]|uniref:hypothetical protein n=1 Tax=unclassified Acidovorax TaxID=2684926 RepID=UPI00145D0710|nr:MULTISPECIES: hypothetical protein [unclassified Acidovorax]NMM78122.1 hypothetical protein [Acidovorax sp. SRB_24]NMM82410.1 hypothetical protein [Acidovorax sp. SRB_14]NMM91117.1 hypothetical protein [Rhodococcus sp. SRB_17]